MHTYMQGEENQLLIKKIMLLFYVTLTCSTSLYKSTVVSLAGSDRQLTGVYLNSLCYLLCLEFHFDAQENGLKIPPGS